jgi:hypothetical protein
LIIKDFKPSCLFISRVSLRTSTFLCISSMSKDGIVLPFKLTSLKTLFHTTLRRKIKSLISKNPQEDKTSLKKYKVTRINNLNYCTYGLALN